MRGTVLYRASSFDKQSICFNQLATYLKLLLIIIIEYEHVSSGLPFSVWVCGCSYITNVEIINHSL